MSPVSPAFDPIRVAIAQPTMHWTGDENADAICRTIERAASAGARFCVFPELAVTGFHRRIGEAAKPDLVAGWMHSIAATCSQYSVAIAVGAPTFDGDGRIYNSQIFIDEHGERAGVVDKKGLTEPEATFFARGSARPVVALQGRRCTAVICREIEDLDDVCEQLATAAPEIIVWPGMMGPEEGADPVDPPLHVQHAQNLARRTGAHVIQSNWPLSLNYPEQSHKTGRSVVIAPTGDIAFALPQAQAGLAVFTLGESTYAWDADPQ